MEGIKTNTKFQIGQLICYFYDDDYKIGKIYDIIIPKNGVKLRYELLNCGLIIDESDIVGVLMLLNDIQDSPDNDVYATITS